jgi:hypothetical protein
MGGTCSTHGKDEKYIKYFNQKDLKGKDNLEVMEVDGTLILKFFI